MNVGEGDPAPLGVTLVDGGVNVAVWSGAASAIAFCLFDEADREVACLPLPGRTGDVFHGFVAGVAAGARYGLRAFGPWDPVAGHRFNPARLLVDPYATSLDRAFRFDPSLVDADAPQPEDTAALVPKAVVAAPLPPLPPRPRFDWRGAVIYEMHVRGFTMRHPGIPEALRGTFAGLGHPAAIAHLRRLGITAVELMPLAACIDERHLLPLGLTNYWGYNPAAYLACDPRLAPGGWAEIRAAVTALQDGGIAVLVDVVLNHSGEGDHLGPTVSMRGLDNAGYYRLLPGGVEVNDTGCGNTLALDRPAGVQLAMAALRHWAAAAGVDGFRLDLATTLGRRADGFDPDAPLLTAMRQDPVLSRLAIIAEPWDIGPGGYQLGAFPPGWGEWNDRYRDTVRRFWRGDGGMAGALATSLAGSADIFQPRHRPLSRSVNFVTAHDGFTLADLVSHERKHNEANGEANRDGTEASYSWNNGVEGLSNEPAVIAARAGDVRAMLATLLLSRGTPMLAMGDELGRTQGGNNNAYAQDNALTWVDWAGADQEMIDFTASLIATRRRLAAVFGETPLTGRPMDAEGLPDVAWLRADGQAMRPDDWGEGHALAMVLYGAAPEPGLPGGTRIAVVLNAGRQPLDQVLPPTRPGYRWTVVLATGAASDPSLRTIAIPPRAVVVAEEVPVRRTTGVSTEELDELARAAGLATSWWDVEGREHLVPDNTKRVLLAALRLPARTAGDVAQAHHDLRSQRDLAPLPPTHVGRPGVPIRLPIAPGLRAGWVTVQAEGQRAVRIRTVEGTAVLPALPIGRYRVMLDDDPRRLCHLTVAPARCHALPAERCFGVAAQLYALRDGRDGGIGDFATLATLARHAEDVSAAFVGINPLHAMFPEDRSRASPYQPSHRGFIDPIYLDLPVPPRDTLTVDYADVWAAKLAALRAAYDPADPALDAFIAAGGESLDRFARFHAIAAVQGTTDWRRWPEPLRHPGTATADPRQTRFICYQQFRAETRLAEVAAASPVRLYRDLAVGSAPDGAEAWAEQDRMLAGVSVGAPPDPFSASGQVWGLPPYDPLAMARDGYQSFASLLRANMRHAGALRIDHVMALRRLFLVPEGASATEGTYLSYPLHDLLGQVTLESTRARCAVVGEDLGTVPDGMREALAEAEILSYRVLWFERDNAIPRPAPAWPARAAACVSTHDLPTLRGWWDGADIAERAALGLITPQAAVAENAARAQDRAALLAALDLPPDTAMSTELMAAVHRFVGRTPSLLALVQAEDLANETIGVNLPGTDRERPNWRRRLRPTVDELFATPHARSVLAAIAQGRVRPGA